MNTIGETLVRTRNKQSLTVAKPAPRPVRKLPLHVLGHNPHQVARLCMTLRIQRSQVRSFTNSIELDNIDADRPLYVLPGATHSETQRGSEAAQKRILLKAYETSLKGTTVQITEDQLLGKVPFPVET